ncbi:Rne/Rng family ribonuclease [Bacillaceae bacterium SIJ1]|uniref:Rne/Rng family ribonuclease n=1 Tax=Litoribacterium kuwaitense TaxID=1398745 RepID=UPI0013EBA00D|nr:Rne/Rng family ribonuclease [Litoribacterium kuwaitense]NGP45482.1 Rne/Rng family ribonuclease [Litoribacterium kuwaitense]
MDVRRVFIDGQTIPKRLVAVENGALSDIVIEEEGDRPQLFDIFVGRVTKVVPSLQAAFIDFGAEKEGFLPVSELTAKGSASIRSALSHGQKVLVQVKKEPFADKGARLTMKLEYRAHGLVYMPESDYIAVSKKIKEQTAKERLLSLAKRVCTKGEGVLFRTNAEAIQDLALEASFFSKKKEHEAICHQFRQASNVQRLSRQASKIEDYLVEASQQATLHIVTNSRSLKNKLSANFMTDQVHWEIDECGSSLFPKHGIDTAIASVLSNVISLKSGGELVIEPTEAMTVIDVNTTRALGGREKEQTIFVTNLEAAREIPRQLHLRDIGGMIVIDFIDMQDKSMRQKIEAELLRRLKQYKARTESFGFTAMGMYELIRKRGGRPLFERLEQSCSRCQGTGRVVSDEEFLRRIQEVVQSAYPDRDEEAVLLRLHPQWTSNPSFIATLHRLQLHPRVFIKADASVKYDAADVIRAGNVDDMKGAADDC